MKILVINGVNLNMLGIREPALYGKRDYSALVSFIEESAARLGVEVKTYQSNYEGDIVTEIQKALGVYDGILINAGAYTHTSLAILDALKAVGLPTVEVHLTDIHARESYRNFSYISEYAITCIAGKGFDGYAEGLKTLVETYNARN